MKCMYVIELKTMNEYIKTEYDEGHDVDKSKRGFMDVKIKQSYDDVVSEYKTTFLSKEISEKQFKEQYMCTWGENDELG